MRSITSRATLFQFLLVSFILSAGTISAGLTADRYASLRTQQFSSPDLNESADMQTKTETSTQSEDRDDFEDPFNGGPERNSRTIPDPFEPVNRSIFWFNDKVYLYGLEPLAYGWHHTMPHYGRTRVRNFFQNLDEPRNIVNSLLQGEFFDTMVSSSRFVINTTVGVGGLFDPASHGAEPVDRNFDQTLRTWGVGPGFYVTLPFLGPSTARGSVGKLADGFTYPPNYAEGEDSTLAIAGISVFRNVNNTSFHLGEYEDLKNSAVDPYSALKSAYEQDLKNGDGTSFLTN